MKKNLFKLRKIILVIIFGLYMSYKSIKVKDVKEDTKVIKKDNNVIKTESKRALYAYYVPKINEEDFNNYYEIKRESISVVEDNIVRELDNYNVENVNIKEEIDKNIVYNSEEEITINEEENLVLDKKDEDKDIKKEDCIIVKEEFKNEVEEINEKNNDDKEIIKTDLKIEEENYSTNEMHEEKIIKKNGFIEENGNKYYYQDDVKITGIKNIDGINHYFSSNGVYLGTNNIKVIDVSNHQGKINWDLVANSNMIYGVILRVGYYNTMDKSFVYNLNELKRLNIPYGIYIYSYATTINGANTESNFVNKMIKDYNLEPTIGIFYDLESWKTKNASSDVITKNMYDKLVNIFVNNVKSVVGDKYKIGVYSGRWYAMNRLGSLSKSYVNWVAEYNKTCKYDGNYFMWQYTSKGKVPGIIGNVDISYIL